MKTKISVLGIDIGMNLCSLVGLDASGAAVVSGTIVTGKIGARSFSPAGSTPNCWRQVKS